MKCILYVVALIVFLGVFPAGAQDDGPVQMDELMCVHLANLTEDEFGFLLIWLDGYFNHMHGTAILSEASLEQLGNMVFEGCTKNEAGNVMDLIAERLRLDSLRQHP